MNDTSPEMDKIVAERYKLMTPERRMRMASSMFETARAIIESSLPLNLTRRERRLAFAKRLYAGELPDAALQAFADWHVGDKLKEAVCILDRGARGGESWTHSLRQRDKWQLRSLQARISLERKESHDEEIPPQSFCGI